MAESLREALERVLRENGIYKNGTGGPHSWRCEYPDRYPNVCNCVEEMVKDFYEVFLAVEEGGFYVDPQPWLEAETGMRFSTEQVEEQNRLSRCWLGLGYRPRDKDPEETPDD